jgi:hypothetical protein
LDSPSFIPHDSSVKLHQMKSIAPGEFVKWIYGTQTDDVPLHHIDGRGKQGGIGDGSVVLLMDSACHQHRSVFEAFWTGQRNRHSFPDGFYGVFQAFNLVFCRGLTELKCPTLGLNDGESTDASSHRLTSNTRSKSFPEAGLEQKVIKQSLKSQIKHQKPETS